jgi:lipopolysaccharide/colanic/teichoic acid biosynthesis glycosyltransferase
MSKQEDGPLMIAGTPGTLEWHEQYRNPVSDLIGSVLDSPALKRCLDVVVAAAALVLLSPLFLVVSLLIKITDGGPVLFVQRRVGRNGTGFFMFKFRSMRVHAHALLRSLAGENIHGSGITFKVKRDPRVTWVGRIIRKISIDELPQLWNILKGDMSLVGPRPALPEEVARYRPADRERLRVLPGLTCFWQVQGRGDLPFEDQVQLDIEYVRTRTLWLDAKLLLLTVPAVLRCRGAY